MDGNITDVTHVSSHHTVHHVHHQHHASCDVDNHVFTPVYIYLQKVPASALPEKRDFTTTSAGISKYFHFTV